MSEAERAQVVAPSLNKLCSFTTRTALRLALGQSDGIRLDEVFTKRHILLVSLPVGLLGAETAALAGSLVMSALWQATLGRADVPGEQRHPDRVQRVLVLRGGGTRQRVHNHYLKGSLWCGRCARRFVIMRGHGNGGTYFYYICRARQGDGCDQPYIRVEVLETAVARHYASVRLSEDFQARVREQLDGALLTSLGSISALKKRLTARLVELDTKEDQYLELVGLPS